MQDSEFSDIDPVQTFGDLDVGNTASSTANQLSENIDSGNNLNIDMGKVETGGQGMDEEIEGYRNNGDNGNGAKYTRNDGRGDGRYQQQVVRTHPRFLARVDKGDWVDRDCADSTAISRMMIDTENMRIACSWKSHPANIFLYDNVPNFIIDRALEVNSDGNYNEHSAGRLVSNVKMLRRYVRIGRFPDPTQAELDDGNWIDANVDNSVALSRLMVDDGNKRIALSWSSTPEHIYIYAGIPQYIIDLCMTSEEMMGKIVIEIKKLKRFSTIPRFPQSA